MTTFKVNDIVIWSRNDMYYRVVELYPTTDKNPFYTDEAVIRPLFVSETIGKLVDLAEIRLATPTEILLYVDEGF